MINNKILFWLISIFIVTLACLGVYCGEPDSDLRVHDYPSTETGTSSGGVTGTGTTTGTGAGSASGTGTTTSTGTGTTTGTGTSTSTGTSTGTATGIGVLEGTLTVTGLISNQNYGKADAYNGKLYSGCNNGGKIQSIDLSSGIATEIWNGAALGPGVRPWAVTLDSAGNGFCSDSNVGSTYKFVPTSLYFGGLIDSANGITNDGTNLYAAVPATNQIYKKSISGGSWTALSAVNALKGSGNVQFDIEYFNNSIYVTDYSVSAGNISAGWITTVDSVSGVSINIETLSANSFVVLDFAASLTKLYAIYRTPDYHIGYYDGSIHDLYDFASGDVPNSIAWDEVGNRLVIFFKNSLSSTIGEIRFLQL